MVTDIASLPFTRLKSSTQKPEVSYDICVSPFDVFVCSGRYSAEKTREVP